MKSLKTENEADSNMKSTIRYTFVASGAIGKGRGRGLKSLGEKESLSSKSLLPQSSDLVKKYIKEIETSSIGKGQGQGHRNSTMSTSQGIRMMHKNSMAPEKENMQINTSSPITNQVKKYTQEVETTKRAEPIDIQLFSVSCSPKYSSIGKGQGQGHKNSTMSTSQGIRMMHKNSMALEKENMQINTSSPITNQVKKYTQEVETKKRTRSLSSSLGISEYEVGSFNKSADFDNQHMETPSKCTKLSSDMSSNHEIQKMKKIVLEKEDMQTNVTLPPSVDQVMNHSKIIE
ncbi:hypothetical protein H5410_015780, partial [Solanum commersonii]